MYFIYLRITTENWNVAIENENMTLLLLLLENKKGKTHAPATPSTDVSWF